MILLQLLEVVVIGSIACTFAVKVATRSSNTFVKVMCVVMGIGEVIAVAWAAFGFLSISYNVFWLGM